MSLNYKLRGHIISNMMEVGGYNRAGAYIYIYIYIYIYVYIEQGYM